MLEIKGLRKRLGGTVAIDDIDLVVAPGERLAIAGANGAGKSTLLKLIAGVLVPDRGTIFWKGDRLSGPARRTLGYVPEAADPPGHLTVQELLHLVAATKGCAPAPQELLERLDLGPMLGALISELSLGTRRKACIAAALVGDPQLLILDEPTGGLDDDAIETLLDLLLENQERTVLLTTHDPTVAKRATSREVILVRGRLDPN